MFAQIEPSYYDYHPFDFVGSELWVKRSDRYVYVLGAVDAVDNFWFFGFIYDKDSLTQKPNNVVLGWVAYTDCDFAGLPMEF